jgi:hypothetical protein
MENKNDGMENLPLDLKRALALKTHLGEIFFVWGDCAYEGALADVQEQFGSETEEIKESGFDEYVLTHGVEIEEIEEDNNSLDYLVLTDIEADYKWEEYLDNYIEDCILDDMPRHLRKYFDKERWKTDARYDGRAHSLSTYDGMEYIITIGGEEFYIYRTN